MAPNTPHENANEHKLVHRQKKKEELVLETDYTQVDKLHGISDDDILWAKFNKREIVFDLQESDVTSRIAQAYVGCKDCNSGSPTAEVLREAYEEATREDKDVDQTRSLKSWMNESYLRNFAGSVETRFLPSLETRRANEARKKASEAGESQA